MARRDPDTDPGLSILVQIAFWSAALGIAFGLVVGFLRLESFGDLFSLRNYDATVLVSIGLGAFAWVLAIVECIRSNRITSDAVGVFGLGLVAGASPFLLGVAAIVLAVAVVLFLLAHA